MNNRFVLGLISLVAIVLAVLAVIQVLGGRSFYNTIAFVVLAVVLSLSLLLHMRRHWMGLLLIGCLVDITLPIPLLDVFSGGIVLQLAIVFLSWAEYIIMKQRLTYKLSPGDRGLLVFGAIMLLQLIFEHPGSARLGGSGGLAQMIYYVFASWVFFGTLFVASGERDWPGATRWFVLGSLGYIVYVLVVRTLQGSGIPFFSLFWSFGFPLFAYLLARAMRRWMAGKTTLFPVLVTALLIMGFSFYSYFRACPYIALLMILFEAIVFKLRPKFWFAITGLLLGVLLLFSVLPESSIPERVRRTVSTMRLIDPNKMGQEMAGEYGWQFDFRASLWHRAVQNIREHPLMGSGWVFSLDEILAAVGQGGAAAISDANALTGGYHNGLLALAAKSGLPAALSFLFAYLYIFIRFLRRMPNDGQSRLVGAVLVGALVGQTVVFLTNGGGAHSVYMIVMLGAMSALMHQWEAPQKQIGA